MSTDDAWDEPVTDDDFERMRTEAMADLRLTLKKLRRVNVLLWVVAGALSIILVVAIAGQSPVWLVMVTAVTSGVYVWWAYDSRKFYLAASQGLDHLDSAWDEDGPALPDPPDDA